MKHEAQNRSKEWRENKALLYWVASSLKNDAWLGRRRSWSRSKSCFSTGLRLEARAFGFHVHEGMKCKHSALLVIRPWPLVSSAQPKKRRLPYFPLHNKPTTSEHQLQKNGFNFNCSRQRNYKQASFIKISLRALSEILKPVAVESGRHFISSNGFCCVLLDWVRVLPKRMANHKPKP